jgi:uncharacterized membrane protein YjfL (UPF0719 family)
LSDFTGLILLLLVLAVISWWPWYGGLLSVSLLASPMRLRIPLVVVPLACIIVVLITLRLSASPDVRGDAVSLVFYSILGAAWLGGATLVFPLLGISARDDVVERHNRGAAWAVNGALVGVTFCFAGANIGSGPGPEAVLFCAALATLVFFLCWLSLELIVSLSERITVDRDLGAGLRLGGFTAGLGIVLGRAVAGPWNSIPDTLRDFVYFGSPVLLLLAVATIVERSKTLPAGAPAWTLRSSIVLAMAYVVAAVLYVNVLAGWS